ncbi:MAG: hypothetical protein GF311_21865 [Candidatus Lokiarchaeota archaeon]|nr:hypothetical protein [Candidatus Lokiarchaeota archaeon]
MLVNFSILMFILAMMVLEIPVIIYLLDNFPMNLRILIILIIEFSYISLIWFLFWLWDIISLPIGVSFGVGFGAFSIVIFIIAILVAKKEAPLK